MIIYEYTHALFMCTMLHCYTFRLYISRNLYLQSPNAGYTDQYSFEKAKYWINRLKEIKEVITQCSWLCMNDSGKAIKERKVSWWVWTLITLHTCTRGKVIGSVIVIVHTKINRNGEKLTTICLCALNNVYESYKLCFFICLLTTPSVALICYSACSSSI